MPPPIYCDEASIALEADCLGETGRDSFGRTWPLFVESLGDFKGPVYVYAAIPFVRLLGLGVVSVRLPAVLFGLGTVALTMLLAYRLFDRGRPGPIPLGAVTAGALLAVSPWHVFFSRAAFEAISLPFLIVLGLVFLVEGTGPEIRRADGRNLLLGALALALTLYTYAPAKATVPLLALAFVAFRARELRRRARSASLAALAALAVAAPAVWFSLAGQGQARFEVVGLFSDAAWDRSEAAAFLSDHPTVAGLVREPRPLRLAFTAAYNYALHLDPRFWLWRGSSNPNIGTGRFGLVPVGILPLLLAGAWVGLRGQGSERRNARFLLAWLAIGPVAASLTVGSLPHATRCLPGLPAFELLAAAGAVALAPRLGHGASRWQRGSLLACGALLSAAPFFYFYLGAWPPLAAPKWESDVEKIVAAVERQRDTASGLELRARIDGFWALYVFHVGARPGAYQGGMEAAVQRRFNPLAPEKLVLTTNERRHVVLLRETRSP